MKRWTSISIVLLALMCCWVAPIASWAQSEEEIEKIEAAVPATPRVAPAQGRKLLVFNLCKGYVHGSIPYGAKAFEIMGRKTGAFETVVSEDVSMFAPDKLDQFDAVCFNNSTGQLFDDPVLKQSLIDFVKGGKGVVGVHAATDCFYNWAEFGEMLGGYFDGHPWGSGDTVTVKLDDPGHALCGAFKGRGFDVNDEIYQIKSPYSREKLRVLLSLDVEKTDMKKQGIKRTDNDFAVSWVHNFGEGRVFYCSLGHNNHIFWTPSILQFYLDGIQFAMGDLEADTTPSAQLSPEYIAQSRMSAKRQALDGLLEEVVTYKFGDSRVAFSDLNDLVIESHETPEFRREIARKLAAILGTDATRDCKQYICRELYLIGTAEQVPAIAALLTDPETSDMARYALERIPDPAADKALMNALGKVHGSLKVGVVNSLGERRNAGAVPALAKLTRHADATVAKAAIAALGKIGGTKAAKALAAAKAEAAPEILPAVADAYLLCADQFLGAGEKDKALAIYEEMFAVAYPKRVHIAAFQGLVAARGDEAVPLIIDALTSDDPEMQAVAAGAARLAPGSAATGVFAAQLPKLSSAAQVLLIKALADRGDKAARAAVTDAANSGDENIRLAALGALGALGDASTVQLLAQAAATAERAERGIARESLDRLRGAGVDAAMVELVKGADAAVRIELIRSLAARNASIAVPALRETAADANEGVRAESFKALSVLARVEDLPALVDLLVKAKGDSDRKEGEKAVVAVARRMPEDENRAALLLQALDDASDTVVKVSLIRALGQLGDNNALDTVRATAKSRNKDLRDAGIRALVDWPNLEPMEDLKKLAKKAKSDTHKVLALRGYLRMLEMPSKRSAAETLEMYEDAMRLAERTEEKKKVIAGMAKVSDKRVREVLESYLGDEDLKEEVQKALEELEKRKP